MPETNTPTVPSPLDARPAKAQGLRGEFDQLERDCDALWGELRRRNQQLNQVYEITRDVSALLTPEQVEEALLERYAQMLRSTATWIDRAGYCARVGLGQEVTETQGGCDQLRGVLAGHIEATRRDGSARVIPLDDGESAALPGKSALLAALPRERGDVGVIVSLRAHDAHPFDESDVLAAESVLAHGAQILTNVLTLRQLQQTTLETVCALVNAIDAKDNYTSDHSERVGGLARMVGEALGLSPRRLQALEWAGLLHDVGKIGVPEAVLNKPGTLSADELKLMQTHPRLGHAMLRPVAEFEPVLDAVLCHHENHDGSGYPQGLTGDAIPLDARIIHVVDVFDALTTDRPYRGAHTVDEALAVLADGSGHVTDPDLTRLFVDCLHERMRKPESRQTLFAHLVRPGVQ